ncbi:hypothetical protein CASFOL_010254 [Castilleja foliolosa]|uniref:Zinc finger, RING/FYVE/PHD-type n=1 Tax=Castilleja foliolosa TaxID=1961234 RepID=A0ABD3DT57_9LAMI
MATRKRSRSNDMDLSSHHNEWDDISCPICMDHPHNAVLLICSSFEKGCRSYICDTSYRHSNCLDRFKTLKEKESPDKSEEVSNLKCPMCRGSVLGWKAVGQARNYLDLKPRACSRETCSFSGNYGELRRHARRVHPGVRPADVDPSRRSAWARLEGEREYDDIVSAVRSAVPGGVVVGDYVIEEGDDRVNTLFLLRMVSMDRTGGQVGSGGVRRGRRASGTTSPSRRRYVWGENLLGRREAIEDEEGGMENMRHRRRRRMTRVRPDEDRH